MGEVCVVQAVDETRYEVEPDRDLCSCGMRSCEHLRQVHRFLQKGKDVEYEAVSAFHKELRRGDVAKSLIWAEQVARMRGEIGVKQYLKSIVFEETRNLALHNRWRNLGPLEVEGMILEFCGSLKKWELPAARGMYSILLKAFADAKKQKPVQLDELKSAPPVDEHEFYNWMVMIGRVVWLGVWDKGQYESKPVVDARRRLSVTICRSLLDEGYDAEAAVLQEKPDYHRLCTGAEALCGFKDPGGSRIKRAKAPRLEIDLLMTPDYAFDSHTAEGRRRLKKGWPVPGLPAPAEVDLRWTGKEIGAYWRYKAFEQFADDYREQAWEKVQPGDGEVPRVAAVGPF